MTACAGAASETCLLYTSRREGKLEDLEESEEINACSIVVPVTIDGKEEEWLVNFKNETHNHPTEMCIRDRYFTKKYAEVLVNIMCREYVI